MEGPGTGERREGGREGSWYCLLGSSLLTAGQSEKPPSNTADSKSSKTTDNLTRPPRLLEEAMGVSSCSTGSAEPLDSDGLVAHNDQVQEEMYTTGFIIIPKYHRV